MVARITFRSEIIIEGKDIREIMDKYENAELFSTDTQYPLNVIETTSIEDYETGDFLL